VIPLIFSAGPDGEYGLKTKGKGTGSGWIRGAIPCGFDADTDEAGLQLVGEPATWKASEASTDHEDNITNHDLMLK
jgi:hypothetical protein